jgi:signal transduction histidine kinase
VSAAYIYITVHYSERYVEETNQLLNRKIAQDIVSSSTPFKNGEVNKESMEKMFDHIMSINPSSEVYLLDKSGNILSFYAPEKVIQLKKVNVAPIEQFLQSDGMIYIIGQDPRHPEKDKIFSAATIMENGKLAGYIYVVLIGEQYQAASQKLMGDFLLNIGFRSIALTLIITFIAGCVIIAMMTSRLTKIVAVMQKFRAGDLKARLEIKSDSEIDRIGEMFNEMADILNQNIEKLKEVEILRRELIANVSHDLRTPISIIHGYIETIQMKREQLTESEIKNYLEIISQSTLRLQNLVQELFELSKLEANQVVPKKEPFFINELISDISSKYQLICESKKIRLQTEIAKDLPMVFGDIALIERVLQNLIDNAIKYTNENGKVIIKTFLKADKIQVAIADSGVGIPLDEQNNILERFYTAKSHSGKESSTGLGLAIVKKILELHQAELLIESIVNSGTTFTFDLNKAQ